MNNLIFTAERVGIMYPSRSAPVDRWRSLWLWSFNRHGALRKAHRGFL